MLIDGIEGIVQRLTVRATVLMSLDGNHVQIPNATVYKSPIVNFTSNPNRRIDFVVGIGYGDSIARAQDIALRVIAEHPAVLRDPEPWVLVESLGSSAVQLRVYVWLDATRHSWLKVRSSVIRLVMRAFGEPAVSMPDEAREVIFPQPLRVQLEERTQPGRTGSERASRAGLDDSAETRSVATSGEARLDAEAGSIRQMAHRSRTPEEGKDLLGGQ